MKKQNKALAVLMGSLGVVTISAATENPFHAQPVQQHTETSRQEKTSESPKPASVPNPSDINSASSTAISKPQKPQFDRRWPEGNCGGSVWSHRH